MNETLELESNQESINKVNAYVDEIILEHGDKLNDAYGNMIIALTEGVNNAIKHGNKNEESKKVLVHYKLLKSGVSFQIEDEGEGFNYLNFPDPTAPENIEKINRRGVFLMTQLADSIEFLENGKKIKLIFNFT